jgi:hypothetical protein
MPPRRLPSFEHLIELCCSSSSSDDEDIIDDVDGENDDFADDDIVFVDPREHSHEERWMRIERSSSKSPPPMPRRDSYVYPVGAQ